jgi:hypothetical protein
MSGGIPYETTLTMQSYVQMRDKADLDFLDVFTPSTRLERELGWDMEIRNLKGVVFQFKRPKLSKDGTRRFSIRYSNQDPPRQLVTVKNYAVKYGEDIAYYALPLVTKHDELETALLRTAFVKALAIPEYTSVIHIPKQYCQNGTRNLNESITAYCSYPWDTDTRWKESIAPSDVFGWEDLYERIERCDVGFKIRYHGESQRERYHDDHRYLPHNDEEHWTDYSTEELFGLAQESAPYITRFGSSADIFG